MSHSLFVFISFISVVYLVFILFGKPEKPEQNYKFKYEKQDQQGRPAFSKRNTCTYLKIVFLLH
jgi:hypothetical protein